MTKNDSAAKHIFIYIGVDERTGKSLFSSPAKKGQKSDGPFRNQFIIAQYSKKCAKAELKSDSAQAHFLNYVAV